MASKERPDRYWTYDKCKEEAKKYDSRGQFGCNSKQAYEKARKRGWLKDYYWLTFLERKPAGYWQNYDNCYEEAKKYKTSSDFEKNSGSAYNSARENGWLSDYGWFEIKRKPNGYWHNYENCYEDAKKYKSRGEFAASSGGAYNAALHNGWLDDYTWLASPTVRKHGDSKFVVYAYEDYENKVAYVGLSKELNRRHRAHINGSMHKGKRVYDNLYKYFRVVGKEIPSPIVKMFDLTAEEAQYYEGWYCNVYANSGWALINKAKTGVGSSSLGLSVEKWDEDSCREVSKNFKSRGEFAIMAHAAYEKARANGWLDTYNWLEYVCMPNNYWHDYDNCYAEALKCKTLTEFHKRCSKGYGWARKEGWIKDYTWFEQKEMPKNWWNYEHCYEEAKKYKTMAEFKKGSCSAHAAAGKKGWLKDYTWFEPIFVWNYDNCFEEAKKYETRKEFMRKSSGAYAKSRKNGWLDDYTWLLSRHEAISKARTYWTRERCYEEAKKCSTSGEFGRKEPSALAAARRNGWISDYTWFVKNVPHNKKWYYETCKKEASKYFSKKDFSKGNGSAYQVSKKNGWLDEFFPKSK